MLLLRAFYSYFGNMQDENSIKTAEAIGKCIWKTDEFGTANKNKLKIDSEVSTDDDKEQFLSILKSGEVDASQKSKYAQNYRFFLDRIEEFLKKYPTYFAYLPNRIMNNCILLPIEAESQDTALRIFSTLNDRGKPLSDTDRLTQHISRWERLILEGSKERIDFIIEYISAYEAKIKIANKNSLFDEAQLFELFAQEICNLWYGKKFTNLNSIKKNYPCVDLLSEDGEIYVQVSTQEDIPGKIKKTLLSLEEEKYPELSNISAPVFFVLSNDTEQKVKDLVGKNQIGRFPFSVKDNFVSTSMIVQRACNDIEFQKSLYDFLKYEIDGISSISSKLLNIFDISKNVGLSWRR